jgi:hypothetical protein
LVGVRDEYAAYCLDGATITFGTIIENALMETVEVGGDKTKRRIPKYTFQQLLDENFHLPRRETAVQANNNLEPLKKVDGMYFDEV